MPDIIKLLPDSVANQIAAGEVIQRPASAVKELLENAIDAGSSKIEVIIKDSGRTLIQVIDNGSGMSPADARMAFERHATSKIRIADDLTRIRTMGFRGEALASISAIAQVELKTRRQEEELGTTIEIEGNEIKKQEPSGIQAGTTISVKNLFYNVPARRNFLKSNTIEARHIIDEFERVAYVNHDVAFILIQNDITVFRLAPSNFRQRIVNINGHAYNERLVPVEENTSILSVTGFIAKPEFCKKTRGEQFLYVNKRFIRDPYLHHAISKAYEELLPHDSFASYWLCIEIDPSHIDVNIHPTKTEIKFDDERSVYSIIRSAVKRSLGMYSVSPTLNFEHEKSFDVPYHMRHQAVPKPAVTVNTEYNPFTPEAKPFSISGWQQPNEGVSSSSEQLKPAANAESLFPYDDKPEQAFQMGRYILNPQEEGLLIIDVNAAREKILYNRFLLQLKNSEKRSQQSLFPNTITLSPGDFHLLQELSSEISTLGFDLQEFGPNTYAIHGSPPDVDTGKEKEVIEALLEEYKSTSGAMATGTNEKIAKALAHSIAVRKNMSLSTPEMQLIIKESKKYQSNPSGLKGKPFMILLKTGDIDGRFK